MKKSLTGAVVLLAGAFMAHSQGTVNFQNYGSGAYVYVSLMTPSATTKIGGASGAATGNASADVGLGNNWTVALYGAGGAGDAVGSLVQLNTGVSGGVPVQADLADGSSDAMAGTWYSGAAGTVVGSFNGNVATVAVAAWYNNGGTVTSPAMAATMGFPNGFSSAQNVTLGGGFSGATPPPPGFPANLPAVGNFSVQTVPEPSTIALGIMGASAFLLRLRKKQ